MLYIVKKLILFLHYVCINYNYKFLHFNVNTNEIPKDTATRLINNYIYKDISLNLTIKNVIIRFLSKTFCNAKHNVLNY